MPFTYTAKQRAKVVKAVLAGLRKGTPLTVICSAEGMPCDDTVRDWAEADLKLGREIARARDAGFDAIAMEALAIADTPKAGERTTVDEEGETKVVTEDMLGHRKLQVETRLKLLAKWDPKRYGDRQLIGSDPENPLPEGFSVKLIGPPLKRIGGPSDNDA